MASLTALPIQRHLCVQDANPRVGHTGFLSRRSLSARLELLEPLAAVPSDA